MHVAKDLPVSSFASYLKCQRCPFDVDYRPHVRQHLDQSIGPQCSPPPSAGFAARAAARLPCLLHISLPFDAAPTTGRCQ
ncbi:hypothetical protein GN956_G11096 [Arapaima gigas]